MGHEPLSPEVTKLWGLGDERLSQDEIDKFRFLSSQSSRTSREHESRLSDLVHKLSSIRPEEVDIARIHNDISQQEFNENFARPARPCMITACCYGEDGVAWPALEDWSTAEKLSRARGELQLRVTTLQGEASTTPLRVKLKHYLAYSEQNSAGADFPFYCFEDDLSGDAAVLDPEAGCDVSDEAGSSSCDDFEVPQLFKDDCYNVSSTARHTFPRHTFFIVGGTRSGTPFHTDPNQTSAWNTLLCGSKRWLLVPPCPEEKLRSALGLAEHEALGGARCPPYKWWEEAMAAQSSGRGEEIGMRACIQRPGETIFVPAGWWHAILNLETSVAITGNQLLPCSLHAAWPSLGWPRPLLVEFGRACARKWPQILDGSDPDLLRILNQDPEEDGEGAEDGGGGRGLLAGGVAPPQGHYVIIINTETVLRKSPSDALDVDSMLLLQELIALFDAEIVISDPCRATKSVRDALSAELARWGLGFKRWVTAASVEGGRSGAIMRFATDLGGGPGSWCAIDSEPLGGEASMLMLLLQQRSVVSSGRLSLDAAIAAKEALLDDPEE